MGREKPVKEKILRVRVTPHEDEKLRAFAQRHDRSVSWVIREYIRRLPRGKGEAVDCPGAAGE